MPAIRGLLRLIPVIAALALLLAVTGARVTPAMEKEAGRLAENRMEQVIGDAVGEALTDTAGELGLYNVEYSDLTGRDDVLSSYLSGVLSDRLEEPQSLVIGIPLGNISGIGFLYGRGPEIKAHLVCMGSAEASCVREERKNKDITAANRVMIRVRAAISYQSFFVNGNTVLNFSIPAEINTGETQTLAFSFSP